MITTQLPNTTPEAFSTGNTGKVLATALPIVRAQEENDLCICDYITCPYEEKVFALTGGAYYKNDKNEFLFRKLTSFDVITIELHLAGVKVADLNNNTYGTFFNGFPSGSAEQQLYVGYLLDWELVYNAFGVGKYTVVSNLLVIGNNSTFTSRVFNLSVYSDIAAYQTVRIESVQNGNIIGDEFDYTDLNWQQSVRIPAVFGNPDPQYTEDSYVDSDHFKKQIKDTMARDWFLQTKKINWEVANSLVYNKLMANEILITDYNIYAESIWRRVPVKLKELSKPKISGNPSKIYNVTFVDDKDIYQKRNF